MARTLKVDRRFQDAVRELESKLPEERISRPKDRRDKSSSANHRAGRGGRAKATIKVFRAKKVSKKISCYVARR